MMQKLHQIHFINYVFKTAVAHRTSRLRSLFLLVTLDFFPMLYIPSFELCYNQVCIDNICKTNMGFKYREEVNLFLVAMLLHNFFFFFVHEIYVDRVFSKHI